MRRPRVFVTRRLLQGGQELVLEHCEAGICPDETPPSHSDLVAGATGKDGLLSFLTDRIDSEVIAAAPELKIISNCAVGIDNLDLPAVTARRIPVGSTPDAFTDATADLTFGLLLAEDRILAPALDVTEPEPLPSDSSLLGLPNCIVVPHLGSANVRTREQMSLLAAESLIAALQGSRLPHCVNPEVYE